MSESDLIDVIEKTEVIEKQEVSHPKRYEVWLHNDDYTPMGFVVLVLQRFFFFNEEKANVLMLQVHRQGKARCGVFSHEIAEMKVALVNDFSRAHEHPLLCTMERVES